MARFKRAKIQGIERVSNNLTKEFRKLKVKGTKGLINVSIMIRRDMDNTPPLIPLDTGNLRASYFTTIGRGDESNEEGFKGKNAGEMRSEKTKVVSKLSSVITAKRDPAMAMGFTANYAASVHEKDANYAASVHEKDANHKRPGSGKKFFEKALGRNKTKILATLARNMQIR